LLLERGYEVVGVVRDPFAEHPNLAATRGRIELVAADLLDEGSVAEVLRAHRPTEIYNLASPSFVPSSWDAPVDTAAFAVIGVTSLLEAVREVDETIRVCQASSAEIFGEPQEVPQRETTPLAPLTPYGAAKAYGHFIVGAYRRRYGLHASCAILFNHESPRRPQTFLPSKVAHAAAQRTDVSLGDLDAERDWGYAPDFVDAMWRMLQQDAPGDYVLATGELHSVEQLVEIAYAHVGLDWREHVQVDDSLRRGRAELHRRVGDASKARQELGWSPSVTFEELVRLLVDEAA
jgi:GDPmannose 4,6-dehydratase